MCPASSTLLNERLQRAQLATGCSQQARKMSARSRSVSIEKYERSRRQRQHAFPPENYDCRGAARPGGELGLGGKLKDLMAAPKMLTESVGGSRAETPRGRAGIDFPPLLLRRRPASHVSLASRHHPALQTVSGLRTRVLRGIFDWWRVRDSNPRPRRCERRALPTELTPRTVERRHSTRITSPRHPWR